MLLVSQGPPHSRWPAHVSSALRASVWGDRHIAVLFPLELMGDF